MFPWKTARATQQPQQKVALVIDGDRSFRTLALRIVKRLGCTAIGLHDAEEAVKWLDENAKGPAPSLIIIDPALRRMDGVDLCEWIRVHELSTSSPVVFTSSRTSGRDREDALRAGADEFLTKPVRPDLLEGTADHFLKKGRRVEVVHSTWSEELTL